MHKLDTTMWNFLKKVLPLAFHKNWMLPCEISLYFIVLIYLRVRDNHLKGYFREPLIFLEGGVVTDRTARITGTGYFLTQHMTSLIT